MNNSYGLELHYGRELQDLFRCYSVVVVVVVIFVERDFMSACPDHRYCGTLYMMMEGGGDSILNRLLRLLCSDGSEERVTAL